MTWVWTLLLIWLTSCATGPSDLDLKLDILTHTSGLHPDPDGYTVSIDGGLEHRVPTSGWYYPAVDGRDHTVLLGDVASNCRLDGENPASRANGESL